MKKIFSIVGNVLGWLIFIVCFSAIGLGTKKPVLSMALYGLSFVVVLGIFLWYQSTHKRRSLDIKKKNPVYFWTLGSILVILGLISPVYFFESFRPGMLVSLFSKDGTQIAMTVPYLVITAITLLVTVLAAASIYMINISYHKTIALRITGYAILIVLAAVPGLSIVAKDSSYGTLGLVYYMTLVTAIFCWTGMNMFNTGMRIKKNQ